MSEGSKRVIFAALAVNLTIAAGKLVAAVLSDSSAMYAEAAHSLADTTNQVFLIIGMYRSQRAPDRAHPFGYAQETYFWSFMVALSIFTLGGGFSVDQGIEKILHRNAPGSELGRVWWAYGVIWGSMALEAISFTVAMREFKHIRRGRSVARTLKETRDPTVLTVLFEDGVALFGLVVALVGIFLAHLTGNVVWDGSASIVIGVALGAVAWFLARDTKSLLLGESVNEHDLQQIEQIVCGRPEVTELVHLRTMHLGPDEVMAAIKVRFVSGLDTRALEARINEIEAALRRTLPQLRRIYIEPGFDERREPAGLPEGHS